MRRAGELVRRKRYYPLSKKRIARAAQEGIVHIESESSFDVVVVGGGIAGCCAAIEAARAGASVCLASASGVFSGSSFYPGTWGLGLVGPRDASDIDDMVETILHVGRGAANAALVDSFVRGIPEAIAALEAMGVSLKRPANPDEPQYIPCFDHSLRMWRGLERDSMERGFGRALCEGGVVRFDGCELLDIAMDGGCAHGALFFDRSAKRFRAVSCGAIVLAGGGVAGLYKRSLSASGNSATVQAIAVRCGARLVNLEFMQIMPGLVAPRRNIVFNEKAFRFARAWDASGEPIARDVLEARSEHGPFSCERAGAPLDFAMEACGDEGMEIACDVGDGSPEFVRTFSGWLERECGVSASAPARIAPYAHASNGGIAIDEHGSCGVPGLFAAGECTGGMHGADRIGGLASANALVLAAARALPRRNSRGGLWASARAGARMRAAKPPVSQAWAHWLRVASSMWEAAEIPMRKESRPKAIPATAVAQETLVSDRAVGRFRLKSRNAHILQAARRFANCARRCRRIA